MDFQCGLSVPVLCVESVLHINIVVFSSFCVFIHAGYYQCFAKNQYGMAVSQISSLQQTLLGSFPTQPDPMEYEVNHGDKLTVSICSKTLLCLNSVSCKPLP